MRSGHEGGGGGGQQGKRGGPPLPEGVLRIGGRREEGRGRRQEQAEKEWRRHYEVGELMRYD